MGKPATVHANVRPPFATSAPLPAPAAANAGIASSFRSQREARIGAGNGLVKVAVSPGQGKAAEPGRRKCRQTTDSRRLVNRALRGVGGTHGQRTPPPVVGHACLRVPAVNRRRQVHQLAQGRGGSQRGLGRIGLDGQHAHLVEQGRRVETASAAGKKGQRGADHHRGSRGSHQSTNRNETLYFSVVAVGTPLRVAGSNSSAMAAFLAASLNSG